MDCLKCGFANPEGARFCAGCGMAVAKINCPHCSTDNSPGSRFCNSCGQSLADDAPEEIQRTSNAERRILTVLFCDLVDSTVLVDNLDPELSRAIIKDFQRISKQVIESLDGRVSTYLGDGIVALFSGHESNAESAINTALQINREIDKTEGSFSKSGQRISVRCGIATGLAVVGDDMLGNTQIRQETAVGLPLNLAARIQSLAEPGGVAIGEATHKITRGLFDFEDIGQYELKGIKEPQQVWRVLAEKSISSRFVAHAAEMTPMVDRTQTLKALTACWRNSRKNIAETVVLTGEAGVGKSRITQELLQSIDENGHCYNLQYQCSPYHANTALYPIISRLKGAAGFENNDSSAQKLNKLETLIRRSSSNLQRDMPAFIDLLSLPEDSRWPAPNLDPDEKKEWIWSCLIDNMIQLSIENQLLITVEDVHWIDHSTNELIHWMVSAIQGHAVMLLITSRPGYEPEFINQPNVTMLDVERLPNKYSQELLDQIRGKNNLPDDVLDEIVQRTEGIPLFIEELSKGLIEGLSVRSKDRGKDEDAVISLPATLQDSLLARLDRLPEESRSIAHLAAVIGREFAFDLLEKVAGYQDKNLYQTLTPLFQAQLILQHRAPPNAVYSFKHALVRDVAYETLLKRDLIDIHLGIARVIESDYTDICEQSPELIAHHFTEGCDYEKAVKYWLIAGKQACRDSATVEARSDLEKALALLGNIENSERASRYELEILLALGPVIMSVHGTGANETHAIYLRAFEISNEDDDAELRFVALWNRWRISVDDGFRKVVPWADELLYLAKKTNSVGQLLQAHHCQWGTLYNLGDQRSCCEHIEAGMQFYDESAHRNHASLYGGHDPKVCGYSQSALSLWLMGDYRKANARIQKGQSWADHIDHLGTHLHQIDISLMFYRFCNRPLKVLDQIDKLVQLINLDAYPDYSSKVKIYSGWAQGYLGESTQAQALIEEGLREHAATGTWEDKPVYLEMLAQIKSRSEDYAGALLDIESALSSANLSGVEYWTAELYRRKGQWLRACGDAGVSGPAVDCYRAAMDTASGQHASTLELRATINLVEVYLENSDCEQPVSLLTSMLGKFDEGVVSEEIQYAQSLLRSAAK